METKSIQSTATVIEPAELLQHWQGHRALTRRVIEAFPENEFYNFSIGGMRPFSQLTMEMIGIAAPGIRGIVFGDWTFSDPQLDTSTPPPPTKQEVLRLWDLVTEYIDLLWPQIPAERFHEVEAAFGEYMSPIYASLLYAVDNEVHHRAQGYVYLRALGIAPPPFWER